MLETYRRDVIAKTMFRIVEISTGASFLYVWFSTSLSFYMKVVVAGTLVLIFMGAWVMCPKQPPKGAKDA